MYHLLISCPDKQGLVVAVSQFIAKYQGNITQAHHYLDGHKQLFFMRNEIEAKTLSCSFAVFKTQFARLAQPYNMTWQLYDERIKKRILLMGSKTTHCVADLLHRDHEQELAGEIIGVLSNHQNLAKMANWYQVPFKHVNIKQETKAQDIQAMTKAIDEFKPDVIVLARYMQIIPKEVCQKYAGKVINIHHSFLPSFIGANPYQRAQERGVKLIGATCHYVTQDLDEGPIIEQEVIRVNHTHSTLQMQKMGQDVEKITLAKGLQHHLENKILIIDNKTIIFT